MKGRNVVAAAIVSSAAWIVNGCGDSLIIQSQKNSRHGCRRAAKAIHSVGLVKVENRCLNGKLQLVLI